MTGPMDSPRSTLIVGGAGFIGSHFTDRLLASDETERVTLYDNFTSGQEWHYEQHNSDPRFSVARGDANDLETLTAAMSGHDFVIHLASNPDIAAAMSDPTIDFHEGTKITHHVVEAARLSGVKKIAYASGSGIYGDLGELEAREDHGPLYPVSTYGASKLAGEALVCAYAHMFGFKGVACRFGNVVGRRQTHGVGFDFVRKLLKDPTHLDVMGDGSQSKSYILVGDVVSAVLLAAGSLGDETFAAYNVATGDYITVREIAELALEVLELPASTPINYGDQPRGWAGDVPIVRIATDEIRGLGWQPSTGAREALKVSMTAMLEDLRAGVGT
jgi:UDP-glucose 4-epimerase